MHRLMVFHNKAIPDTVSFFFHPQIDSGGFIEFYHVVVLKRRLERMRPSTLRNQIVPVSLLARGSIRSRVSGTNRV
jgi:hypothetical protein